MVYLLLPFPYNFDIEVIWMKVIVLQREHDKFCNDKA